LISSMFIFVLPAEDILIEIVALSAAGLCINMVHVAIILKRN